MTIRERVLSPWNIFWLVWRFFQFVLALAVIGLYGQDLNKADKEKKYTDGKWVFAVITSSLSAVTALAYMLLIIFANWTPTVILFAWDWILTILWAAVMGIFGSLFVGENAEMDAGVQRMINAVYVDATNLALWGIGAILLTVMFFRTDRSLLHRRRGKGDI